MSVHYDSFDCLDYPVYIWASSPEDARVQVKKGSSDRLIEVYHLASSMEHQLNEVRAFHYEPITIDEALDAPAEEP